jgi:hypothetical protein
MTIIFTNITNLNSIYNQKFGKHWTEQKIPLTFISIISDKRSNDGALVRSDRKSVVPNLFIYLFQVSLPNRH